MGDLKVFWISNGGSVKTDVTYALAGVQDGEVEKKCGADEVERIKNDMQEIIDDLTNNREAYYEQAMKMREDAESIRESVADVVAADLNNDTVDIERSKPVVRDPALEIDPAVKNNL